MKVTNFDIVFISYDEPKADELFEGLKAISPRPPLRVHGVKGFDAAHKKAAEIVSTDRFITVDGDNIVNKAFFDEIIPDDLYARNMDLVYSYTSLNLTNCLAYGNGGVKIWPRRLVLNVDTHEKTGGNDFCWTYRYMQQNMTASSVVLQSPYHAWRAGYREAVKLSLIKNEKLDWKTTLNRIYPPNLSRLLIWASVGADAMFGDWAIYGARCGLEHVWLNNADPNLISDYTWFDKKWNNIWECVKNQWGSSPRGLIQMIGGRLEHHLDIEMPEFNPDQSRWVKRVYENPPRTGLMIPDMKAPI